ncbi:aldose epimerase family protein [Salimicrobium flavidum]|uniref:Galactose mutarotase n=1 Tax=Salimicrobium flavidum TaxID=570947 RepID=A0A1N7IZ58_9BACI|nr:DUF5107 domain-containing protein [Salimicrobium flavidum]SIS42329.1 Galactose mutarotase [Salimicrobium flavidum]
MEQTFSWKMTTYKGLEGIELDNEHITCVILPSYGGKMVSLYDKEADYEWLYQSDEELVVPPYGADFSDYDSSGFDEMFPGIDEGPHPTIDHTVPDHGEVWTMPWSWKEENGTFKLEVTSPVFPYTLKKEIKLMTKGLLITYEAINHSAQAFPFIWTAHALLNMDEATEISVPEHLKSIMNVEKATHHLGSWGTPHTYPVTQSRKTGTSIDLSKLEPREDKTIEKFYFTERLDKGNCAIVQKDIKRTLTYEFPEDQVPYLGVWKNRGGYRGEYNVALEPCTGVYDDVYIADKIDKVSKIPAAGTYEWTLKLEVGGI